MATLTLVPNGAGDYTNIANQWPNSGSHYDKVDDPVGSPDEDSTYVTTASTSQQKDAYNLIDTALSGTINWVKHHFRIKSFSDGYTVRAQPFLRLGSTETTGTEVAQDTDDYTDYSETLGRPGGGAWSWADINALQVCIGVKRYCYCTQVYIEVDYTVAAVGLSHGHIFG
jgi:hypothetical protein